MSDIPVNAAPRSGRRLDTAPCGSGACQQPVDPLGLLWVGQDRAIGHEVTRLVFPLTVVEDGFHIVSLKVSRAAPVRDMFVSSVEAVKPRLS